MPDVCKKIRQPTHRALPLLALVAISLLAAACSSAPKVVSTGNPASAVAFTPAPATSGKTLYLTLDADMSQSMAKKSRAHPARLYYDPQLFEYLHDEQIPAAFFVSGLFADVYPDVIRRLAADPLFSLQNHSYDESAFVAGCYWLATLTTDREKIEQIKKTQDILTRQAGKPPVYFRYPGLCRSASDDRLVEGLGLQINEGDIIASDPFNNRTDAIVANVLRGLKDRGVIIMHVGGPNAPESLAALRRIVPEIKKQGYVFRLLEPQK